MKSLGVLIVLQVCFCVIGGWTPWLTANLGLCIGLFIALCFNRFA